MTFLKFYYKNMLYKMHNKAEALVEILFDQK